jgi:hypothetical protein
VLDRSWSRERVERESEKEEGGGVDVVVTVVEDTASFTWDYGRRRRSKVEYFGLVLYTPSLLCLPLSSSSLTRWLIEIIPF